MLPFNQQQNTNRNSGFSENQVFQTAIKESGSIFDESSDQRQIFSYPRQQTHDDYLTSGLNQESYDNRPFPLIIHKDTPKKMEMKIECRETSNGCVPYTPLEDYIILIFQENYPRHLAQLPEYLARSDASIKSRIRILSNWNNDRIKDLKVSVEDNPNMAAYRKVNEIVRPVTSNFPHSLHKTQLSYKLLAFVMLHQVISKLEEGFIAGIWDTRIVKVSRSRVIFVVQSPIPMNFHLSNQELIHDPSSLVQMVNYFLTLRDKHSLIQLGKLAQEYSLIHLIDFVALFTNLLTLNCNLSVERLEGIVHALKNCRDESKLGCCLDRHWHY